MKTGPRPPAGPAVEDAIDSPLAAIRELEDRMAARIQAAKAAAAASVAEAREHAELIAATEHAEAERRADLAYRSALAAAVAEADAIRAEAAADASRVLAEGERMLDGAAEAVVAFVLPPLPSSPSPSTATGADPERGG